MNEKEKRIQEQRTIEATKKNLMGLTGKIGTIVRNLGQPMIAQCEGGTFLDTSYLDDPWALPEENTFGELDAGTPEQIQNQIPYMEVNPTGTVEPLDGAFRSERDYEIPYTDVNQVGWHFEGLSNGLHMEIMYNDYSKQLTLTWKGYLMYKEIASELATYVPHQDWEDKVDYIFEQALNKEKATRKEERKEDIQEAKAIKQSWLNRMRQKWGI